MRNRYITVEITGAGTQGRTGVSVSVLDRGIIHREVARFASGSHYTVISARAAAKECCDELNALERSYEKAGLA